MEKDFGRVHDGVVECVEQTSDGACLLTGDRNGVLKQWLISDRRLTKDWGKVSNGAVKFIAISQRFR